MIKCEGGKVELEEDANKLLSELTAITCFQISPNGIVDGRKNTRRT